MANVNPAMQKAVENRRRELRLEPRDLVRLSGLTRQAIGNVRKGVERKYHDSTVFGIARALQWEDDWYDRLRAGEQPVVSQRGGEAGSPGPIDELARDLQDLTVRVQELEAFVSQLGPQDRRASP